MRTYELMFILRPDMVDEDLDKLISTLESNFTGAGGTVKSVERMGKRRLAYIVRSFHEGNYVLLTLEGDGQAIHEIERRMRVSEPVIKFLTVRVDEEQKRIDKIKKIRATKIKRRPEPIPMAAGSGPAVGTGQSLPAGGAGVPSPAAPAAEPAPAENATTAAPETEPAVNA